MGRTKTHIRKIGGHDANDMKKAVDLVKNGKSIHRAAQECNLKYSNVRRYSIVQKKEGQYVGCDANGNKYYMNDNYMIGRSRWVEHNIKYRWDYDATHVTSEWYGWLHYKTDKLPCEDCAKHTLLCSSKAQIWLQPFEENMTGTDKAYYPYSTTKPKTNIWDGLTVCNRFE